MKTNKIFYEQRNNWATPYKFNAKELDQETGLYYYGARYYNPTLSIWGSVDPMSDKYPHQSNYMYCSGRPVNVIDPDGRDEWELNEKTGELKNKGTTDNDVVFIVGNNKDGSTYRTGDKHEYVGKVMSGNSKQATDGNYETKINFASVEAGKEFFDFAIDKTIPEWSYSIVSLKNDGSDSYFRAFSSGERSKEYLGSTFVESLLNKDFQGTVIEYGHSHPGGEESIKTSDLDIENKDRVLKVFPDAKFNLYYLNNVGSYRSRSYNDDTKQNRTGGY